MGERRPKNSELRRDRLERIEDEAEERERARGILEVFPKEPPRPDEDAPLARDDTAEQRP